MQIRILSAVTAGFFKRCLWEVVFILQFDNLSYRLLHAIAGFERGLHLWLLGAAMLIPRCRGKEFVRCDQRFRPDRLR